MILSILWYITKVEANLNIVKKHKIILLQYFLIHGFLKCIQWISFGLVVGENKLDIEIKDSSYAYMQKIKIDGTWLKQLFLAYMPTWLNTVCWGDHVQVEVWLIVKCFS